MKSIIYNIKLAVITGCILLCNSAFAHEKDTLKCELDTVTVFQLYPSAGGGYICGNNAFGDKEIAQKFGQAPHGDTTGTECTVPDEHQLNEILVWFGAKYLTNPNDSVYINVYGINHATGGPGALLGSSYKITLDSAYIDISTDTPVYADFLMQLPVQFTDSFFLSVVLPQDAGDTLGIMSSKIGDADSLKLCWIRSSSNNWSSVLDDHGKNINAVIFPIVGDAVGLNEKSIPVVRVNAYPNPANDNAVIKYSLQKPVQQLLFTLLDISGRVVYRQLLNNNASGDHNIRLNTGKLRAGNYFYSFETEGKKVNGKLEVVK